MKILFLDSVASTQDVCFELLAQNQEAAVVARTQSSGRGRFGKKWHSPRGGLWLSLGMFGVDGLKASLAGPVAVCRVVWPGTGPKPQIKPPNDVMVQGKKLAGVLVETRKRGTVLGVGINVSQGVLPDNLKAVCLEELGWNRLGIQDMATRLVGEIQSLLSQPTPYLIQQYQSWLLYLGKPVRVNGVQGVLSRVEPEGFVVGQTLVPFGKFSGVEEI